MMTAIHPKDRAPQQLAQKDLAMAYDAPPRRPRPLAPRRTVQPRYVAPQRRGPAVAKAPAWIASLAWLTIGWSAGAAGCDAGAPRAQPQGLRVVHAGLGTCTDNGNGDVAFPPGAERVVVRVTGGDNPAEWVVGSFAPNDASKGSVVLSGVTPGEGLTVDVVACAGAQATWAGQTQGVAVRASEKSFPTVFLTPLGQTACLGTSHGGQVTMARGRAFAASARLNRTVYVLGGLDKYSNRNATATATVSIFDTATAEFREAASASLLEPRALAFADPTANGSVRVIGGASGLVLNVSGRPPVWVQPTQAPTCGVELFDVQSQTGSCEIEGATLPAAPTVAKLGSNDYVAVGGVTVAPGDPAGWADSQLRHIHDGDVESVALSAPTFGAAVVPLDGDHVLIWGGRFGGDVSDAAQVYTVSGGGVMALATTGLNEMPLYGSATLLDKQDNVFFVAAAGGTAIKSIRGGTPSFSKTASQGQLDLIKLDLAAGTAEVTPLDLGGKEDLFARAMASMVRLADGDLWWLGGFTSFVHDPVCPDSPGECLQDSMVRARVEGLGTDAPSLTLVNASAALTQGPFGATPVSLGDGAWLVTAGFHAVGTTDPFDLGADLIRYEAPAAALCSAP